MKKFSLILLFLIAVLSFTACKDDNEGGYINSPTDSDEKSTVNSTEDFLSGAESNSKSITESDSEEIQDSTDYLPERPYYVEDWINENEFTEDDLALQQFLSDTAEDADFFGRMFYYCMEGSETKPTVFPQMNLPVKEQRKSEYYSISSIYPQTLAELEARLKEYFTAEAVESFMKWTAKGVYADNGDGTYSCTITEGGKFDDEGFLNGVEPRLIECDGRLYYFGGAGNNSIYGYWETAKITSQTDNEIVFTYLCSLADGSCMTETGRLVNESGWKYSWRGYWWL